MNKNYPLPIVTGIILAIIFTSCEAVADIFTAGVGVGVFIVIIIVVLIVVMIMRSGKK